MGVFPAAGCCGGCRGLHFELSRSLGMPAGPVARASSARTRAETKRRTREALVRAATEMFAAQGLGASLDQICAHAGYTRGAFYVHFRNRDELAAAVMERVGAGLLDALLGGPEEPPVEDLGVLLQRFALALQRGDYPLKSQGGLRPYQLLEACARSEAIRSQYLQHVRRSMERLEQMCRRLQERGQVRADLPAEQFGFLLITLVIGLDTLRDLAFPLDIAASGQALLRMVAPSSAG